MNPIAFYVFGIPIRWYGILISIGIMIAYFLGSKQSKIYHLDFDEVTDIFIVALPVSILCARLYYVIFEWSYYSANPSEILNIRGGGLAIHGGILGAVISSYIMCRVKKVDFLSLLDTIAPSFILAQAIGRWGNFFNQEAHGGMVSKEFISHFPDFIQKGMFIDGAYYHPTFLYESMWNLIVFAILMILSRKNLEKGSIFYLYIMLYSVGRFFIEGLRTDSLMLGSLRMAQVISIIFILLGFTLLIMSNKKKSHIN
ncbi:MULTISPECIES: prolipoprotein diacylglyceryl transferase [Clostridium]|uniref:Phosphatidylglycerol--prolipoprotein diacylglyceryl transferase n=2 Tax=Clostridium TaxID=1485 RepID=A0A151ALI3_9CLOT|nr:MULTISPECIES: prolipoprotein diacylglyceryl transferase [Clostridium]KYH28504.1 prolipoprotein diacylglyceryl transferase [Clostridium colicanis DSM 13634]PRR69809.1 Prolipoprotein diacylglyceryl transferase [Clostridium thermopalmarium DSM 5974]PVZ21626.1 prolipoprotein diacylglyceryl transferase [Clostridium thermopalmarium DSM 5974]